MENGSEYAQSIANRLHSEGTDMQMNMEHAIMSFRQQNQVAMVNNADLQIVNRRAYDELGLHLRCTHGDFDVEGPDEDE